MNKLTDTKLRLYHYWRSSSSWRVRWAFALKGIPCEFVSIDLLSDAPDSPEHLTRNPMGYVPVLEFLEEKRPPYRYLAESLAILEWLEEQAPFPSMLPRDPLQRAKVRQLAEIINSGTQPLQNPNTVVFYSSVPEEQKKWSRHWIEKGFQAYESVARETAGKFSMGDVLTIADLCLIPQCYNAQRQKISLSPFPTIERIHTAAMQTTSYQASCPEKFQPI